MVNELDRYTEEIFDDIKRVDEDGNEFWYARELMQVFKYSRWENFRKVIEKAQITCFHSDNEINSHFEVCSKIVKGRSIIDYKLSRYACYLIIQNADPRKEAVALGKTYIATQTRLRELSDQDNINKRSINQVARASGVKNINKFHDAGYQALYGGETEEDIARRKGLENGEDILDNMSMEEQAMNFFRISLTEQILKKQENITEEEANEIHARVGSEIRNALKKMGSTMPEDL